MYTPGLIASNFVRLDDSDILASSKYWADSSDMILSNLAKRLINRDLFAIELQNEPFTEEKSTTVRQKAIEQLDLDQSTVEYFVYSGSVSNLAYTPEAPEVKILLKNGATDVISSVSDMFDQRFISERIVKYFLCYPKEIR